jgi:uncharacterized membrane protein
MKVENTIHIDAPAATVWAVTEDVERWPDWSPSVNALTRLDTGPFRLGSSARIAQPGLPEATWTVAEFARGERFSWETRVLGMRMIGSHVLVPERDGTTSVLAVEVHGLVARLLWPLTRPAMARAIAGENLGLKRRCEARALD